MTDWPGVFGRFPYHGVQHEDERENRSTRTLYHGGLCIVYRVGVELIGGEKEDGIISFRTSFAYLPMLVSSLLLSSC